MAIPKCPKCDWTMFQATTTEPAQSNYKLNMIHCAKCGCVVGVMEYFNINTRLEKLAKKLGINLNL